MANTQGLGPIRSRRNPHATPDVQSRNGASGRSAEKTARLGLGYLLLLCARLSRARPIHFHVCVGYTPRHNAIEGVLGRPRYVRTLPGDHATADFGLCRDRSLPDARRSDVLVLAIAVFRNNCERVDVCPKKWNGRRPFRDGFKHGGAHRNCDPTGRVFLRPAIKTARDSPVVSRYFVNDSRAWGSERRGHSLP